MEVVGKYCFELKLIEVLNDIRRVLEEIRDELGKLNKGTIEEKKGKEKATHR